MNGTRGDHPVSDIVDYGLPVFSEDVDALVREIAKLVSRDRLWEMFAWFSPPPLDEFKRQLAAKLQELRDDARDRGWEV